MQPQRALIATRNLRETDARCEVKDCPIPVTNRPRWRHLVYRFPQPGVSCHWPIRWKAQVATVDTRRHPVDSSETPAKGDDSGSVCDVLTNTGQIFQTGSVVRELYACCQGLRQSL